MQWSHSSLKQFQTCARQYHELRILRNYQRGDTEQTLYGNDLHAAAEAYVKTNELLPQQFDFVKPVLDALNSKEGEKHTELQLALDIKLRQVDWKSKKAWVRGIIDLLILDGEQAWVVDYKTGNDKYADTAQLDLMSILTFACYPEVQQVNSALLFVVKDNMVKHKRVRADCDRLWAYYREEVAKVEAAQTSGVWNPTQSGLCKKYCEVISCEYNGKH